VPIFPTGLYWIRTEGPSIGLRDARYVVLWLFPAGTFRYIACWPGYSWFEASGTWRYGNGHIHCRGKSHSFTDDFSDNHNNRPYTTAFTSGPDGQAIVSIGATPQHYTRLSPQQLGPLFELDERTVPTRWQDFQILMWKMEKQIGLVPNEEKVPVISICNNGTGVTIFARPRIPPVIP
jgi:hypothetical protein